MENNDFPVIDNSNGCNFDIENADPEMYQIIDKSEVEMTKEEGIISLFLSNISLCSKNILF